MAPTTSNLINTLAAALGLERGTVARRARNALTKEVMTGITARRREAVRLCPVLALRGGVERDRPFGWGFGPLGVQRALHQ